jgi:peptidoglycan/LPS O-acetylase OafA/YrhL
MEPSRHGYRGDIDGLRAAAVFAVVLFHLDVLPGGFIGVTVFFVISGYLVGGNLLKDDLGAKEFYRRRMLRIAPALSVVVVFVAAASFVVLEDAELQPILSCAAACAASLGNVWLWLFLKVGYFSDTRHSTLLLHMWSLGVEEQFYWLLPPLMHWVPHRLLHVVVLPGLVGASSWAAWWASIHLDPSTSYYLLPFRAAELLVGVWLAVHCKMRSNQKGVAQANAMALLGLVVLAALAFVWSSKLPFPSVYALVPTAATALIIFAGTQSNPASGVLASAVFAWIGTLSYSMYLWHWPAIVLLNRWGWGPHSAAGIAVFVLALVAWSWLSYTVVETPFRRSSFGLGLVAGLRVALVLVLLLGLWTAMQLSSAAGSSPTPPPLLSPPPEEEEAYFDMAPQYLDSTEQRLSELKWPTGRVLVVGDSHARRMLGLLQRFASTAGKRVWGAGMDGCPSLGVPQGLPWARHCATLHDWVLSHVKPTDTAVFGRSILR